MYVEVVQKVQFYSHNPSSIWESATLINPPESASTLRIWGFKGTGRERPLLSWGSDRVFWPKRQIWKGFRHWNVLLRTRGLLGGVGRDGRRYLVKWGSHGTPLLILYTRFIYSEMYGFINVLERSTIIILGSFKHPYVTSQFPYALHCDLTRLKWLCSETDL